MARNFFEANASSVALVAATAKTILTVTASANVPLAIWEWQITLDGATAAAVPVTVEIGRPTTAGTSSAYTPRKLDPGRAETIQATAAITFTVEPTMVAADLITLVYVPAYNGQDWRALPINSPIIIPGGGRFALRCTAPANVNVSARIRAEE